MDQALSALFDALRERLAAEPRLAELDILSQVRPSVRLKAKRVALSQLKLGESRIGGIPDLPTGFAWPRWNPAPPTHRNPFTPATGMLASIRKLFGWSETQAEESSPSIPLSFIAQIDLSSIPAVDSSLPHLGWLYFFYDRSSERWGFDPADRGCCAVAYADCERAALSRAELPEDTDPHLVAQACRVEACCELTLPDSPTANEVDSAVYDAYELLCEQHNAEGHRLLGYPQPVQGPMELECQLVSHGIYCGDPTGYQTPQAKALEPGASDWVLLLQIDTDEAGPGWMWGDAGTLYFWIKKQDLAARRFAEVWLIQQCC